MKEKKLHDNMSVLVAFRDFADSYITYVDVGDDRAEHDSQRSWRSSHSIAVQRNPLDWVVTRWCQLRPSDLFYVGI